MEIILAVENSKSEEPHYESLEEKFCILKEILERNKVSY